MISDALFCVIRECLIVLKKHHLCSSYINNLRGAQSTLLGETR